MNRECRYDDQVPKNWDSDRVDRAHEKQVEAAYFDNALSAWVLSRYADVAAAFRSPALVPAGPRSEFEPSIDKDAETLKMRSEVRSALSGSVLGQWQPEFEQTADTVLDTLKDSRSFDLVSAYAKPLCNQVAVTVTGIAPADARNITDAAEQISAAAAEPFNDDLASRAKVVAREIEPHFPPGPVALRESGFVALSLTLCRMLSNAWLALLQRPDEWARLHSDSALTAQAIDELLRFAGLPRILFRIATRDVTLNGTRMRKGDRVILRLIAANRDPEQFENPGTLSISGQPAKHLSLGAGVHLCAAAPLLRMVMMVATRKMVERFRNVELRQPIEWEGGSGFLYPSALHVLVNDKSHA